MFLLQLSDFAIELDEGAIKNVGASNKSGTAKLFDVETADARGFGDKRVKCVFEDDEGNEVQVALFPEAAQELRESLAAATSEIADDE
jgi:alanine racemase